jgi:hypothetical protein
MRRILAAGTLAVGMAAIGTMGQIGQASGGDFSLDFTAAAPFTYNHLTGGGSYNDRTVGKFDDIVESLEGGDYFCSDVVTYLTQIKVAATAVGSQTIRLNFQFTAHSTGQQGVALVDNDVVARGTSAAINGSAIDTGTVDDGGSTATVVPGSEIYDGLVHVKPTIFYRSVDVTDLEAGETVVLRSDVIIDCDGTPGASPTGNMQARLASAQVIAPAVDTINSGDQTVPFKKVGLIKRP